MTIKYKEASMNYWLIKSEPFKWSWDDQVKHGTTHWDGVRNHLATTHLKTMRLGDKAFFYHSNEGKEIVGIVEVVREFYLDPADPTGKFGMVDVKAVEKLPRPVTLAEIKGNPDFATMALVRLSRLSVGPVTPDEWERITKLGGLA
jgi:predicted RNA-binding protein with PUA-like domain